MEHLLTTMAPMGVAAFLGGVIGLERQWHQGMAGLRTNALVAASASAFVHLPIAAGMTDVQPASLAGSVITGIGFLGAGVILREGMNVRGLNTAATLWGSAAVGAYAGSGLPGVAGGIAMVILSINVLLRPVISRLNKIGAHFSAGAPATFRCSVECLASEHAEVRGLIIERSRKAALHLRSVRTEAVPDRPEAVRLDFELVGFGRVDHTVEHLLTSLSSSPTVCSFAWARIDDPGADPTLHPSS